MGDSLQSRRRGMRAALVMTTTLSAVILSPGRTWAACTPAVGSPNDVTCSGATPGLTVDVTTPADINVTMTGGSSITSDGVVLFGDKDNALNPVNPAFNVTYTETGATTIINDGVNGVGDANGIFAGTSGDNNVRVTTHTGSQIHAANNGVNVYASFNDGNGGAYVNSNGSILADQGNGVFALNNGEGLVQIVNTGKIGFDSVTGTVSRVGLHGISALTFGYAQSATDTTHGFLSIRNEGEIYADWRGIASSTQEGGRAEILNKGLIDAMGIGVSFTSSVQNALPGFPNPTIAAPAFVTNEGTIRAGSDGLYLHSASTNALDASALTVENKGSITGDLGNFGAFGINVESEVSSDAASGDINIVNFSGAIIKSGGGIAARSFANGNLSRTGSIGILNAGAIIATDDAIDLLTGSVGAGVNGPARIENTGLLQGGFGGVSAISQSATTASAIDVINSGTIEATVFGVSVVSESTMPAGAGSSTSISNTGTIAAANGAAIDIFHSSVIGVSNIVNAGLLRGAGKDAATATIAIDSFGLGNVTPTTIANSGIIRSNDAATDALAIAAGALSDGAVSVANAGLINGRVALTDNADVFALSAGGVWRSNGLNDFFGGANRIDNSGALQVGNGAGGEAVFSATGGALVVNNSGVVDLWNDGSHSVANMATINGTFDALSGSQLAVDAQLGPNGSVADRLTINGTATGGVTFVSVYNALGGVGAPNTAGITVARINGADSGGGFALSPNSPGFTMVGGAPVIDAGLYFYTLEKGAGVGCNGAAVCYSLYSGLSTKSYILPVSITTTQALWQETALMWEDRQTELRDAGARDPEPTKGRLTTWIKPLGAWTSRSDHATAAVGPRIVSHDLSYRQNSFGIMGGANYAIALWSGELNAGVIGGYVQSDVNFRSRQYFRYEGATAGASASYMKNGFFVDGLFKADVLNLQLGMPMGAYSSMWTSAETLGGVWNVGYRYDWGRVFIEPTATLTFSTTRIGRLNELAAYGVDARFGNGEDFRGGFGGRVGTTFVEIVPGHALEVSFTGRVWDQFASNGGRVVDIMNGAAYHSLGDYTLGQVYGEAKGNLALLPAGPGLGAYVSGGARFNEQFTTWTARGGVAYRW